MLQALLTWTQTTTCEQTGMFQELLHQCFALSASPDRHIRVVFAHEAQAFAQPGLLTAMYGSHASGSSQASNISAYEAKLLQVNSVLLRFAGHILSITHTQYAISSCNRHTQLVCCFCNVSYGIQVLDGLHQHGRSCCQDHMLTVVSDDHDTL